jgi:hypothetical protein
VKGFQKTKLDRTSDDCYSSGGSLPGEILFPIGAFGIVEPSFRDERKAIWKNALVVVGVPSVR